LIVDSTKIVDQLDINYNHCDLSESYFGNLSYP
jgi:hypothetical protein